MSAKHFLGGAALGAGLVYFLDSGGPKAASGRFGARRDRTAPASAISRDWRPPIWADGRTPADVGRSRAGGGRRPRGVRIAAAGPDGRAGSARSGWGSPPPHRGDRPHRPRSASGAARSTFRSRCTSRRPLDRVYAFWTAYDNFPLFMTNVRQVRGSRRRTVALGGERTGKTGAPVGRRRDRPRGEHVAGLAQRAGIDPQQCRRHPIQPRRIGDPDRRPVLLQSAHGQGGSRGRRILRRRSAHPP